MKKFLTFAAVATASLLMAAQAHAQFGIVGGLTSSKANLSQAAKDVKNISLYHAGLVYKIDLGSGFALQPGVIYQVKGSNLGNLGKAADDEFKLKTGFVEVPLGIQWGPDLMAFRPYAFAEPFIGYQISSSDKGESAWKDAKNKFEYGFGLGAGLEIAQHVQISCQWFKNLGNMFGDNAMSSSDTWNTVKDMKNFQGVKVTLGILF